MNSYDLYLYKYLQLIVYETSIECGYSLGITWLIPIDVWMQGKRSGFVDTFIDG